MVPRGAEHGRVVVREQRAGRIEWLAHGEPSPEFRVFLGHAEVVRGIDGIEAAPDAEVGVLDREDLGMGVGDEDEPATRGPDPVEERARIGQPVDFVPRGALHRADVERERAAPVVDAIPVESPGGRLEDRPHQPVGFLDRDATALGESSWQMLTPEALVVGKIE